MGEYFGELDMYREENVKFGMQRYAESVMEIRRIYIFKPVRKLYTIPDISYVLLDLNLYCSFHLRDNLFVEFTCIFDM